MENTTKPPAFHVMSLENGTGLGDPRMSTFVAMIDEAVQSVLAFLNPC